MIKVKHHKTNTELISYKFLLENYVKAMDKELYEKVIFSNTNNNTSNNNNQNDEKNLIDNNSSDDHLDTCIGIMLGIVCGDCLGSPCEFYTFKQIRSMYSDDLFYNMITVDEEREAGVYTDDTEMALALTSCIIHKREINADLFTKFYVKWFRDIGPRRGYGPAVSVILNKLYKNEMTFRESATSFYKDGSYANGALMRIAPLAAILLNSEEAFNDELIYQLVYTASMTTHVNIEAVDAAFLQVRAIIELVKKWKGKLDEFKPQEFLEWIISTSKSKAMREKLAILQDILYGPNAIQDPGMDNLNDPKSMTQEYIQKVDLLLEKTVGNTQFGFGFQVKAVDAFSNVLFIFLQYYKHPEQAIVRMATMGGDADTTSAILGGLIGALHGTNWIPQRWFDKLENDGDYGRDAIIRMAIRLSKLTFKSELSTNDDKEKYVTLSSEDVGFEKFKERFE